jgi:hypothetical protein
VAEKQTPRVASEPIVDAVPSQFVVTENSHQGVRPDPHPARGDRSPAEPEHPRHSEHEDDHHDDDHHDR